MRCRRLPVLVLVRRGLHTLGLQIFNHAVEGASPHALKPVGFSEPLDQRGADGVVGADEGATVPSRAEGVVASASAGL